MKVLYKSLFRGWVEVTEEQKENLIKYLERGITALSGIKKKQYIESRFKEEKDDK